MTHETLDVKKYGLELGESRVYKNVSATQRNLAQDLEKLDQGRRMTEAKLDKAFELLDGLGLRLAQQNPKEPIPDGRGGFL